MRKSSIRLTAIAGCSALLLGVVTYSVCHPGQEILVTGHDETGESMKEIPSSYQLEISDNKKIVACMVVGYPNVKYKRTVPRKAADIKWI